MFRAMPAERTREHTVPVAAARRRRLRADQARQLADLLRHQILAGGYPTGVLPLEDTLAADTLTPATTSAGPARPHRRH